MSEIIITEPPITVDPKYLIMTRVQEITPEALDLIVQAVMKALKEQK